MSAAFAPAPAGRMGEIREFVEAVLDLEVAAFVTGESLHVDGLLAARSGELKLSRFRY
jgi:NAD(P)-dependent dehydrogenase (short-subunit alcohol dehydrogenase family)